jgi:hypothetical protein
MNVYEEIAKIAELIAEAHELIAYKQYRKKKLRQKGDSKSKAKKNYMKTKVQKQKKQKRYRKRWKQQLTNRK